MQSILILRNLIRRGITETGFLPRCKAQWKSRGFFIHIVVKGTIVRFFKIQRLSQYHIKSRRDLIQGFRSGFFGSPRTILSSVECFTSRMAARQLIAIPRCLHSSRMRLTQIPEYSISVPLLFSSIFGVLIRPKPASS